MKRYLIGALLCVIVALAGWLLFSFPYQRHYAERTFEAYTQLQGVDPDSFLSLVYQKDYVQNAYYVDVRYKEAPELRYQYHYFFKRSWGHHAMTLIVFDEQNCSITDHSSLIYPPFPGNLRSGPMNKRIIKRACLDERGTPFLFCFIPCHQPWIRRISSPSAVTFSIAGGSPARSTSSSAMRSSTSRRMVRRMARPPLRSPKDFLAIRRAASSS